MRYQAALHSELFLSILLKKRKDGNNKKKPASPHIFCDPHRHAPLARSHAVPLARVPLPCPVVIRSRGGRARCLAAGSPGSRRRAIARGGLPPRCAAWLPAPKNLCVPIHPAQRLFVPLCVNNPRITRAARSLPVGAPHPLVSPISVPPFHLRAFCKPRRTQRTVARPVVRECGEW